MKDIDHKLSREIVNIAKTHDVSVIKLERLQNIRSTTRTSRKNNHSLHTWSFYRLATFIEDKAKLAGIKVEYVEKTKKVTVFKMSEKAIDNPLIINT